MYWDANNICGCLMFQKVPVDHFKWKKTHQTLMKCL